MGQQQGCDEGLNVIVTSMELEINLQPLYRVYDPFLTVSQSRCWRKVRVVVEGQRKSVCISRVCSLRMYLAQVKA